MGKKRYNAKARQVVKTNIDDSQTNEIKVDFASNEYGSTDASNLLALPSKKRSTKIVSDKKENTRFLSKAQRKRLGKIVDKKKKKANRAALIESLAQVQATPEELQQLTSLSAVQTLGLRKLNEYKLSETVLDTTQSSKQRKISSIKGAYKRRRLLGMESVNTKKKKYDPNVVGLEESSDEESSESDEEPSESDEEPEVIESGSGETNENDHSTIIQNDKLILNAENNEVPKESGIEERTNQNTECAITDEKHNSPIDKSQNDTNPVQTEKSPLPKHPAIHIDLNRDPKVQVARLKLPILGEEQRIMELVNENDFLIVAGETGSGKTTQLPQFLYEAGYAEHKMIAVTEPRRVATVAMSQRVAHEMGLTSKEVSYLMRFEGNVTKDTRIKFMTDGVLLKEIQSDFFLSKYSVVIIDEAHERSAYTDLLLGLLSRTVPLRRKKGSPLKVIIMSATLQIEDFTQNTKLFKEPPPVIKVEARQYPVTIHFNRHTNSDYLKEAFKKTVKIHTRLPEGGILIFVTGQQEINHLVHKLKAAFPYRKTIDYSKLINKKSANIVDTALDSEPDDIESDDDEVEKEMKRMLKARRKAKRKINKMPKINLDDYNMLEDDEQAELWSDDDSEGPFSDSEGEEDILTSEIRSCRQPLWVLPLYAMLSSSNQARVFKPPPVGARLCVVSTDVAETSLTIPAIKYVVDTGKKKMRIYNHTTGASTWRVAWTSQASAGQRAGRAGRTGAGHAYRLYSAAVHQHDCPPRLPPDVCRRPVDDLVLTMKSMRINRVANFPFPTPPDRLQLHLAEKRLEVLLLLEKAEMKNNKQNKEEILKITPLGEAVATFPVLPRYGKMLALSHQANLLPYTIALVSALTVQEVMSGKADNWPAIGETYLLGDPGVLLRIVGAVEYEFFKGEGEQFCTKYGLREKAIKEIRKLRKQMTTDINQAIEHLNLTVDPEMKPPSDIQAKQLRQLLCCGLGDQVARKIGLDEIKKGEDRRKYKYAYHVSNLEEPVYLHSESILRRTIPEWVMYQELYEAGNEHRRKMVMRNVAVVEPKWLPVYVPKLCNLGEPLVSPEPRYDEESGQVKGHFSGTYGKKGWELPIVEIDLPNKIEKYRWFARFLLEGKVFPKLKQYTKSLLSSPSTMVKSWARLQVRTEILLKALVAKQVASKNQLEQMWEQQPKYLLHEYLKWVPQSAHNGVILNWPPNK